VPDFETINDRLIDIMYETVGLVGIYTTAAAVSLDSEHIVHSTIIGACNDTSWIGDAQVVAVFGFGSFSIVCGLGSMLALALVCWRFQKSFRNAYNLYQKDWVLAVSKQTKVQLKKRHTNFFK
jgi:hypothetical protein